jgi:hypothetical protein
MVGRMDGMFNVLMKGWIDTSLEGLFYGYIDRTDESMDGCMDG